jgi:PAS domain S-box-containing protein
MVEVLAHLSEAPSTRSRTSSRLGLDRGYLSLSITVLLTIAAIFASTDRPRTAVAALGVSLGILLFVVSREAGRARTAAQQALGSAATAEEARRLSESRFRMLFDQSPLSLQVFAPDGRVLEANQAWRELSGVGDNPASGEPMTFDHVRLDRNDLVPLFEEAVQGRAQAIPPFLYKPPRDQGKQDRWTQGVIYPVTSASGAVAEVVLLLEDVTEHRHAAEAARTGEEQLRLVTDALPVLISYVDRSERYRFVNKAYEAWFGRPSRELVGATLREVLGGTLYDELRPRVARALAGERIRFESSLAHPEGPRDVLATWVPDIDPSGEVRGVVALIADITEHVAAERRLREQAQVLEASERRQRFLADSSTLLATSLDSEATLARVARLAIPELADWCAVDLIGPTGLRRVAAAHRDPLKTALLYELSRQYPPDPEATDGVPEAIRTGRSAVAAGLQEADLARLTKDDAHRDLLRQVGVAAYAIVPLRVHGRRILGAMTLARSEPGQRYVEPDLAVAEELAQRCGLALDNARLYEEAQDAYREAQKASRMKDEFLATLSHELRTPLNAIVGWSHLLRDGLLDPPTAARAIETINRNAKVQDQLISDILDVSRIVAGRLRLRLRRQPIGPVVEAAVDTVRPAAGAKDIRLEMSVEGGAVPVTIDPDRIQQVVWNLLSNAVKFAPNNGHVKVVVRDATKQVEVTVEDDGPGIDPLFLPHVFERFRQADSSSTRSQKGLGLGLAIVRHLAELHGGTVEAANREVGQGAIFTVRIPIRAGSLQAVAERRAERPGTAAPLAEPPSLKDVLVLVVDDEADARELVATVLERSGAEVIVTGSAVEALGAIERHRPDVLLSDIEMPGEDGYALLRSVRSLSPERGGSTPAAALSAYAGTEDRTRALKAGFQLHIAKPAQPSELVNAVASLSGRAAALRT